MKIWLRMRMIIHKSRKKAVCITVAGLLAGIAGGLVLYYVRDVVLGWCFVITAGFALLYGMGSLFDRRPYIVLTEYGITEPFAIREQIEWDAVLYADDFYFRGQYWVRLLLGRDYKPQLISCLLYTSDAADDMQFISVRWDWRSIRCGWPH